MNEMLIGAVVTLSVIIGMFFLRFWRNTRDRFFLFLSASFVLQAIDRFLQKGDLEWPGASPVGQYILRILAYALILIAILDKNKIRH
jgi:hypothetical protein